MMNDLTLSKREADVLGCLSRAMTNKAIGKELGISPHTANQHVKNILRKLGMSSRVQAAIYALKVGAGGTATEGHNVG